MANQQYKVKTNERWDNIAFKAYGDPSMIEGIVQANPDVMITAVIPAGTVLEIPILDAETVDTTSQTLPPWMQ